MLGRIVNLTPPIFRSCANDFSRMASMRDSRIYCEEMLSMIGPLPRDYFEGGISRRREQLYGTKGICEKVSNDPRVARLRDAPEERERETKRLTWFEV